MQNLHFDFKKEFEENYISKLREIGPDFYYQQRQEFNDKWKELEKSPEYKLGFKSCTKEFQDLCMKFIFLTQSSFSHQLRYNNQGGLNMAYSKFDYLLNETVKTGFFNKITELANFIRQKDIQFFSQDWNEFIDIISCIKQDMFIYCDPPYVGTIQDYIERGFNEDDLRKLVNMLEEIGVNFAISGCCTEEDKEKTLDFFAGHKVVFKDHKYNMNSKGQRKVNEYIAMN